MGSTSSHPRRPAGPIPDFPSHFATADGETTTTTADGCRKKGGGERDSPKPHDKTEDGRAMKLASIMSACSKLAMDHFSPGYVCTT